MIPQLVVSGMAVGILYGLVALGVILIFKSTNILNFAHGELAMVSTFFAYTLLVTLHFPYPLAVFLTLLFAPAPGEETRRILGEKAREGQEKAGELARRGREVWAREKETVATAIERGVEAYQQVRGGKEHA